MSTESEGLLFASGEPFATGVSTYFDAHPDFGEPLPRIYVEFQPEGLDRSFVALLDTGGHYCILHPDIAEKIQDRLVDRLTHAELLTAQGRLRGELYSHRITLLAQRGDPLDVDAILFISPDWRGATVLGYVGVVDRIRFAVDSGRNRFYCGPLA